MSGAFRTQPDPSQTGRRGGRFFRLILSLLFFIFGLAVIASLLVTVWWRQPSPPPEPEVRPVTGRMPDYDAIEEPPPPHIVERRVEVPVETVVETEVPGPPRPIEPIPSEPERDPIRLGNVAFRIDVPAVERPGYRDGRIPMRGQGCALRPGVSTMPAKLITAINSEIPGQVIAEVSEDIFSPDLAYENKVLVPAGTRVVGMLDKGGGLTLDRERVDIAWTEMTNRYGFGGDRGVTQVALGRAFDASADGSAGSGGVVEMRWGQLFAYAALTTIFNVAQRGAVDGSGVLVDAQREASGTVGEVGNEVVERSLDWEPRISIRAGTQVRILIQETVQVC
ncbi:TrbI/VirB10 family protein [Marinivivus vitaminiproducens]|uniref:TrbI/VirB10 family protein n=1 Tax=Marinivivus vitaminiproducens TaxID=3035935 RepID=UPI0027A985B0|nr:TrbI/VirB10 family protein [Geminicoccaceae bacterium SCSIO 64248]